LIILPTSQSVIKVTTTSISVKIPIFAVPLLVVFSAILWAIVLNLAVKLIVCCVFVLIVEWLFWVILCRLWSLEFRKKWPDLAD